MKHLVDCAKCGETIIKYPYQLKANKKNFCNRGCKEEYYRKYKNGDPEPVKEAKPETGFFRWSDYGNDVMIPDIDPRNTRYAF